MSSWKMNVCLCVNLYTYRVFARSKNHGSRVLELQPLSSSIHKLDRVVDYIVKF